MAAEPFILLVAGFLLTSVAGGALASGFQRRAWRHQYDVQRADHLREQALKAFEEVSSLLDQRLYRMLLVYWAAKRRALDPGAAASLDAPLAEYRAVLRVWNDNLNRILALVHTYFGEPLRWHLQSALYDEYAAIGEELDTFVREVSDERPAAGDRRPIRIRPIKHRLDALGHQVYVFNVLLLRALRDGRLGEAVLTRDEVEAALPAQGPRAIRFGHTGDAVRRLQRALRAAGAADLVEDGHFGRATERAVADFQLARGLPVSGFADPATARALDAAEAG